MRVLVFDHVIPMTPVTWKRARSHGAKRWTDKRMVQAKSQLGWEVKAAEPKLRCDSTARFGFSAEFFTWQRLGDGDNYEKLLLDALQGIVWENDEQVDEGSWRKIYNADKSAICLRIWRIE